ncbi:MAG: SO_0444 family Cu/Zn efflux transporter [Bacteroidales bacterium]|nr:SO_0444 family Cu/Zn efflux transporter [Bacteroidales bacterium]
MKELLNTLIYMLGEMAPYILLGFFIAGLLHAFVPQRMMSRHLSGTGWRSVVKAALFGIPLPLCSCGVLPTAVALRRNGASRAASTSFLIATPQTGVDSIAATYSLLGPAFAVVRPLAALATSLAGGCLVGAQEQEEAPAADCALPHAEEGEKKPFMRRFVEALRYGFYDMVQSIGGWLVVGLVIAAIITVFVPENLFLAAAQYPILAMLAVVAIAIPMYVCATGSIPIALSLMLKGLTPGAAFVLLMAGPAANFASITVVSRALGKRSAAIYITTIVLSAIAIGCVIDYLLPSAWFYGRLAAMPTEAAHCHLSWLELVSAAALTVMLAIALLPQWIGAKRHHHCHCHDCESETNNIIDMTKTYKIQGMQCPHCKASVERGIAQLPGVEAVTVDLSSKTASVTGSCPASDIERTVTALGFDYLGEA